MGVTTYQPQATVTVYKRIERRAEASSRVQRAARSFELTPFLGDGCSIRTQKDIRAPAGAFSIVMTDEADRSLTGALDSLIGFAEPMDYVEISMARTGQPRIVMRGFLTTVQRSEDISGGKPVRRVILSGQDYGKVPQMVSIVMRRDLANQNFGAFLTAFPLLVKYGFDVGVTPADTWMSLVVNAVLNPFLKRLRGFVAFQGDGAGPIPLLGFTPGGVPGGIGGYGLQPFEGTMQGFIRLYQDEPWNEAFIEDRDEGPAMVYRPIPYTRLSNRNVTIQGGAPAPYSTGPDGRRLLVLAKDIVRMSTARTDQDVANIFFVNAPKAELQAAEPMADAALLSGSGFVGNNPNCAPELYGDRVMEATSQHVSPSLLGAVTGKRAAEAIKDNGLTAQWFANRRDVLKALYQDNVVYESGGMTVAGDADIRPGRFLDVQRGSLRSQVYVTSVGHLFEPFRSFTTTVGFDRGTGFADRTASQDSEALAETGRGPYDE